jgi:hypothetical protein
MAPPADQYVVYRGQYLTVEFYYTQAGQIPAREFYVLRAEEERTRFFHIVQHLSDNPPGIQLPKTMFNMEEEEERIFAIKPYSGRYLGFYTRDRRFVLRRPLRSRLRNSVRGNASTFKWRSFENRIIWQGRR